MDNGVAADERKHGACCAVAREKPHHRHEEGPGLWPAVFDDKLEEVQLEEP